MSVFRAIRWTLFAAGSALPSKPAPVTAPRRIIRLRPVGSRAPCFEPVDYVRSWKTCELRCKTWDDLHKLWYVLLKEKNMLVTQNLWLADPERLPKVRRSMDRIKHVLTERAVEDSNPWRSVERKKMIKMLCD